MAVDVKNLVAAINPDVYCDDTPDESGVKLSAQVKKIVKKDGFLKAAEKAKPRQCDYLDIVHERFTRGAFEKIGLKSPIEKHTLVYDVFSQSLEPIYFWILDYVNEQYDGGAEKLVDNFVSSPGGGHFAEMNKRASLLQDEAMKIFGVINTVVKSVLNLIYDLKEFKIRLAIYDDVKSKDEKVKNAAMLSLKQIWMDSVDIKRGNTAIKLMAQQFDYVTLIDAFMAVESLENVDKLDLNERVKRILQQRVAEFFRWIKESDRELRKRFEIEKIYLRSQVNSLKLYARWLKPNLKAARALEQNLSSDANIVNAFNTSLFQLILMAKGKYDPDKDVATGELPEVFKKLKKKLRKYVPLTIVEFNFRTAPDRTDARGGYGFRGRVEITFSSYALNEDELKVLREQMELDDFGDVYKVISGATDESLAEIQGDLKELLEGVEEKEEDKKSKDVNPFSSLFGFEKKAEKKDLSKGIPKDSDYESVMRSQAILGARWDCRKLYNNFKKAQGMLAFPPAQF